MNTEKSNELFSSARKVIPGGVNSPVRACKSVGTDPLFIDKADGAYLYDADGNRYIDYVGSWGPMIIGHRHPAVLEAVQSVMKRGLSFGAPTDLETELAEMVIKDVPSIEMVRMVNSGTEATMSAIRLARGVTNRGTIIKFDGCYHGHSDSLLVDAGSGVASLGIPGSPGVPQSIVMHTLSLPYNDPGTLVEVMRMHGESIACIIFEPVAGNMGLVKPLPEFLTALKEVSQKYGTLLICDEVMTGFRVALGGAQEVFDIEPDLTCLGKVIGGGMPVGAYGGKKKYMNKIAPEGPVYQAGTLSGNPVAMAAGIATLKELEKPGFYENLDKTSERLLKGLENAAASAGIKVAAARVGSMLGMYFCEGPVNDFMQAKKSNLNIFTKYYTGMREMGVYLAPSQFEAAFVSAAHAEREIDETIAMAEKVLGNMYGRGA